MTIEHEVKELKGLPITFVERWLKSLTHRIKLKGELLLESTEGGNEIFILRKQGVTTYQVSHVIESDETLKELVKEIRTTERHFDKLVNRLNKCLLPYTSSREITPTN